MAADPWQKQAALELRKKFANKLDFVTWNSQEYPKKTKPWKLYMYCCFMHRYIFKIFELHW